MPALDQQLASAEKDAVFDTEAPLSIDAVDVGRVRYGISLEELLLEKRSLFRQGLSIASTEVLLTIILLSLAGIFLTKHIKQLLGATSKVAAGDYSTTVKRISDDEIGDLADNFNLMTQAIRDRIQAIKNSEYALYQEKERALVTLQSIGDGVITTDINGRIELMNPVAERLTGWLSAEAHGNALKDVFIIKNEITHRPIEDPVSKCLASEQIVTLANHTILESRDGNQYSIEDSAAPIRDREGNIIGVVLVFHDVSGARHLARQMAYQARHDALTGLVNRTEFEERVHHAMHTALVEHRQHVLFYMDLDEFKVVNDTCGHFAGDEMLKSLATLLKDGFRDNDTLARLGGDEFGVLLESCPLERARLLAEEIRSKVDNYRFQWDEKVFEVGISIGVVTIDQDSQSMADVLSAADVACYIAKEQGRNRIHVHNIGDIEHARRKTEMQLVSEISSALEESRFRLYYQEIFSLQNRTNDHRHIELLVRMLGRNGELVPPFSFITAAERFHLMPRVDTWVIQEVLRVIGEHDACNRDLVFAINLSGHSVADHDFLKFLVDAVRQSKVNPRCLCFEITETAAISNLKQAVYFISEMKNIGCRFSLDDFGSGLSSFTYLKNLDVDYLKIDGAFVKDILKDETDAAMVEAINQIGHIMGLKTVAEYVESDDILAKVRVMGIDYAQGFSLHVPCPLTDFFD